MVGRRGTNAVKALLWPLKKREIIKNRERLSRLCANLHTAVSLETASSLRTLKYEQEVSNGVVKEMAQHANENQELKVLDWLSPLDHTVKHTAITALKQPGTDEWFLQEQTVQTWLDHGDMLWLHGASGRGKTVLT